MSRWTLTKCDRFTAKRQSRLPCDPRGSHPHCTCFVRDEIINLTFTRRSAWNNIIALKIRIYSSKETFSCYHFSPRFGGQDRPLDTRIFLNPKCDLHNTSSFFLLDALLTMAIPKIDTVTNMIFGRLKPKC